MRKKSHLSLAGFLVQGMDNEVLSRRWRSFYLGNILPDCKPSFVTVRHEYDKTFDLMAEMLRALAEEDGYWSMDTAQYMRDLGQIVHYIADYFTYPHNTHFPGNIKDHCVYEEHLKHGSAPISGKGKRYFTRAIPVGCVPWMRFLPTSGRNMKHICLHRAAWKTIVHTLPESAHRYWLHFRSLRQFR